MSASTVAPPAANTSKRDYLIQLEHDAQKRWQHEKQFETDSPFTDGTLKVPEGTDVDFAKLAQNARKDRPKWMGTFPYPYMNGSLHLGHAFTISKIEFAAGFERMRGKRALWPVGFHCTGMPIKSAADKIIREMEIFGPTFEGYKDPSTVDEADVEPPAPINGAPSAAIVSSDPSKAKKGKLAAKSTGLTYQFQIMRSIGVPLEEIQKFADPQYWLTYFPPIAQADITDLGGRVDWRRSFITTPANPYYDSFVRWQMNKLKALGYIKFGKRYTIFSPKDGQPCMDHDRQSGEGVGPQEYTALKMPVTTFGERAQRVKELAAGRKVVLVAATLRPETMYGQTSCFVGPTIEYGLYPSSSTKGSDEEVLYLVSRRAARNMAYQGLLKVEDSFDDATACVGKLQGAEMIGTKVAAPNAIHGEVCVLPMETVSATKGTAVVACVPSDSPDDWITQLDLQKKAEYYKIDPAWASLEPVPVLSTPTYGDLTAKALVEKLRIQSPKDTKQLAEAKEIAYKEGFYQGTMVVGPFKGSKVEDAKTKVRDDMIERGLAFAYSEPENLVMSRSADECIVALCDQWYLDYGEPGWLKKAEKLLSRMNTYNSETRHSFERTLGWLRQWACARSYGLGSKLPWDPQFLVESLSDSTIYMAYYTIAHLLHGPPIDGSVVGPLGITAEQMTDEMWDYVYANGALPADAPIPTENLNILKAEFSYFYPMDIRSSGKDLIPNHLSFCIYVHSALFAEENWPLSMRANGHLMLNGEKMSKSTGNSLTLRDALLKFGADATRLTLADAGDSIEDANFEEATANAAILRLKTLTDWSEESIKLGENIRESSSEESIWDKIFANEINEAIELTLEAYEKSLYKEALKYGFYQLLAARDSYRDATAGEGGMRRDLIERFVRVQALLITPIAPHVAEHLWSKICGEKKSIQQAQWPEMTSPVDRIVLDSADYIRSTLKEIRDAELGFAKKKAKGKGTGSYDPSKPKAVKVWVAKGYPEWQDSAVALVREAFNEETNTVDEQKLRALLTEKGLAKDKKVNPFIAIFKKKIAQFGPEIAFNRQVLYDEKAVLDRAMAYVKRQLGMDKIDVVAIAEIKEDEPGMIAPIVEAAEPGKPGIVFYNVEA
ncbi:leucyl-tRNA synthetase, cytoplasmic [Microbotryum lychnidis-dioicae p1A1 Lamole]|uniref:leucine--tRNA ligase n=1 Tax=Microbotryum lychnidis-dioicae (strain p1A1 Lamole / MvSl-1064) TaxID=683840 RepID=U5H231_USTV1|nr:leucyl-tRNA synthetase, cytoplasmic [Microbotryum lychnidis-dioicae p1A1 Lamole]|eukprot:KDE08386.1 leucyl-tRNA synthetase, cytoplasmic [Microbotryum lychnidis-dioicae p1A1 Lamole]